MVMTLVKTEAPAAGGPVAEAQQLVADIRRLETDIERRRRHVAAAGERIRELEEYAASRREALCRLVAGRGGSLELPGLAAPLRVKVCRAVRCNPARLAPWLAEHAPQYVREVTETRIDRRALKKALRFRGSGAYLSGIAGAVPGVAVSPSHSVVIPAGAEDQKNIKGDGNHGRRRKTGAGASAPQIRA